VTEAGYTLRCGCDYMEGGASPPPGFPLVASHRLSTCGYTGCRRSGGACLNYTAVSCVSGQTVRKSS
jgi:hypothetical protein